MEPILMRNSSQNAGCIRRLPASHSCHPRRVQWISAAAPVCESPAASRAARTSSGAGFRAGLPARLRDGWLGNPVCPVVVDGLLDTGEELVVVEIVAALAGRDNELDVRVGGSGALGNGFGVVGGFIFGGVAAVELGVGADVVGAGHFGLLPQFPRRGCRVPTTRIIRNACNKARPFCKIFEGGSKPSNADVTGLAPAQEVNHE